MASITSYRNEDIPEGGLKCSFCGQPADAFWDSGNFELFVCNTCAFDILPKLIADSVFKDNMRQNSIREFDDALVKIEASFNRGAFFAAWRSWQKKTKKTADND